MDKKDLQHQGEPLSPEQKQQGHNKPSTPEPPLGETNDDEGADGLDDDEAGETGDELRGK
ncbi:hypothetical protein [Ferruginibacter sp. HRS2-29]|uniref:hypothetical protein n=1 Tax=Ferruginibacter sp. HRS2-29 TaxID=2487334 RepID=UPI0020CD22BD|nr:hypothetical protein [Ferruginibacter sp. HRS2-29]MCP9750567.1 hypothetical protein [Ferruginibacter sp. HRS2-29]